MMKLVVLAALLGVASAHFPNASKSNNATRQKVRIVMGGSVNFQGVVLDDFDDLTNVVFITAAGINPEADARSLQNNFDRRGIPAEWCPVFGTNCATRAYEQRYVDQVLAADGIFFGGGQSGRLQRCLFGGRDSGTTPLLDALRSKLIVGGSSAGAMHQPTSNILITGTSVESYAAVSQGRVFYSAHGNAFINNGLVDSHFSERGRQGRLLVLAATPGVHTKWAFGVDEDSAFKAYEDGNVEVIGTNGVVIYEDVTTMSDAKMHFLTRGDVLDRNGQIRFASWKTPCSRTTRPNPSNSIFGGVNFRTVSIGVAEFTDTIVHENWHGTNPAVRVAFDNREATSMCGTQNGREFKSFSNLRVSIARTFAYHNPEKAEEIMWEED